MPMTTSSVHLAEKDIWAAYNQLMLSPDVERLRKVLVRHALFQRSLHVPGDIVECGVFKGVGLLTWLKFLRIHAPGSVKRVIGFDMFSHFPEPAEAQEARQVHAYVQASSFTGVQVEELLERVVAMGMEKSRCELVAGDIRETAARYVATSPGMRISLLHLDLDLADATRAALEAFWPRVSRGGVVVFDEYAVRGWTESDAVDDFFRNIPIQIATLPWAATPTAFIVKQPTGSSDPIGIAFDGSDS